jgi:hypothetical protein
LRIGVGITVLGKELGGGVEDLLSSPGADGLALGSSWFACGSGLHDRGGPGI